MPEINVSPDPKTRIQTSNKQACTAHILSKYDGNTQRSAVLLIYGQTTLDTIADFVARCIAEKNQVYDILEASQDPESEDLPIFLEE